MKFWDHTFETPEENLACDEALLDWFEEGGDEGEGVGEGVLRFWRPAQIFIVVGYGNEFRRETRPEKCEADGIPILRRCSGGGTVLQSPGCLNYALVLPLDYAFELSTVNGANRYIMERHRDVLNGALPGAGIEVQGYTDLAMAGRKFSGNSQRRKRSCLLFHGVFLCGTDPRLIEAYLPFPSKAPDYRAGRSHAQFVVEAPVEAAGIKECLKRSWKAKEEMMNPPWALVRRLVESRYGRRDWHEKN